MGAKREPTHTSHLVPSTVETAITHTPRWTAGAMGFQGVWVFTIAPNWEVLLHRTKVDFIWLILVVVIIDIAISIESCHCKVQNLLVSAGPRSVSGRWALIHAAPSER